MTSRETLFPDRADVEIAASLTSGAPEVAIVLGSGLGGVVSALEGAKSASYSDLLGMRGFGSVAGHAGRLVGGTVSGRNVLVFQGRLHMYQGADAYQASYPARLAAAAGVRTIITTNAVGALTPTLGAGDLVLIRDHINLLGDNPLVGWPGPEGGAPFVPMGDAYDGGLATLTARCAREIGIGLKEGVYVGVRGPSFETPAEVDFLRGAGGDVVGMSTVPEVIAARALGLRVIGISLVTNAAGGSGLVHADVIAAGERGAADLAALVSAILARL